MEESKESSSIVYTLNQYVTLLLFVCNEVLVCLLTVVGTIMSPKEVHTLILKFVNMLHYLAKMDFADAITIIPQLVILRIFWITQVGSI